MNQPRTLDLRPRGHAIAMSVAEGIWAAICAEPGGLGSTGKDNLPWMQRVPGGEDLSRELSLSAGYPAVALLFAELAAHDRAWRPRLHTVLSAGAPRAGSAPVYGLFSGAMSFAFALHMAGMATGGYGSARRNLNVAISQAIERQLKSGAMRQQVAARGLFLADYDLISGLSGALRYLLLDPSSNSDLIALLLAELVSLGHLDQGRPGWTVAQPPSFGSDPADFPYGHVNVGLAHGAAGILAAMSLAMRAGVMVPGQEQAIETISEWLLANQMEEAGGINWPPFLVGGGVATRGTSRYRGWCYGVPGIARALQLASNAAGNERWSCVADAAMKSMFARAVSDERVLETGLCHGWAGTMHVTWRFGTDSADEPADAWVDESAARVIDRYDPSSRFGFLSPEGTSAVRRAWTDDGGFLTGAAGIALALHRYSRDAAPATLWDSALLVV